MSFGDLKNHIELLKKYMTKMNMFEQCNIKKQQLEEATLKLKNPEIFLRLVNYVIVQYSPEFYKKVLDLFPTLTYKNDRKFIEHVISISRKVLSMNPQITAEQFLSNNFLQKKLQFTLNICMKIYDEDQIRRKAGKQSKNSVAYNEFNSYLAPSAKFNEPTKSNYEDDEDLLPRELNIKSAFEHSLNSKMIREPHFVEDEDIDGQISNYGKKTKPNVFPKNIVKNSSSESDEKELRQTKAKIKPIEKAPQFSFQKDSPSIEKDDSVEYVTKEEFNEVVSMLASMNNTINNMASKFNSFQESVTGWVNNINAKVSILESNVKMIKQNL